MTFDRSEIDKRWQNILIRVHRRLKASTIYFQTRNILLCLTPQIGTRRLTCGVIGVHAELPPAGSFVLSNPHPSPLIRVWRNC
jgi:hypothetical protein